MTESIAMSDFLSLRQSGQFDVTERSRRYWLKSSGTALACSLAITLLAGCAAPADKGASQIAEQSNTITSAITSTSAWQQQLEQWRNVPVLLLGEQHDMAEHQAWQAETITYLAQKQRLAGVVMEMAPAGGSTKGLSAQASEEQVKAALLWEQGTAKGGWPWAVYGPVVMAAVRAGVPVMGGNLPPAQMRAAMQNTAFDSHLPADGWQQQLEAIDKGHCGLLPQSQWVPMARIQLARDQSMARVATAALPADKAGQVLIISGGGHSRADIGVPTWLPANIESKVAIAQSGQVQAATKMKADWWQITAAHESKDHCAGLREQWKNKAEGKKP